MTITRERSSLARRRAHYLQKIDEASDWSDKVSIAGDYVRALLVRAPEITQKDIGERAVAALLATTRVLESIEEGS